jgi:DNA ligase-1
VLLSDLATASRAVAATSARSVKVALLADALRAATPGEVEAVVAYLSGELRQRRTGVGWATLREAPPPAAVPTLSVGVVDDTFAAVAAVAGTGAATERRRLVGALFAAATAGEQDFLRGLVSGELRQGALEALVVEAVARASALPAADVRRAVMLRGSVGPVAVAALTRRGLGEFRLVVGRPVQPMLASPGSSVGEALARTGEAAVEWKLDGVRVQVHRDGDTVAVFTRSLDEVTARVPEVVAAVRQLPVRQVVLDGEAIALRPGGRPRPFQETASRFASPGGVVLTTYFFDVLHVDGADLLALPARDRFAHLPAAHQVPRLVTGDPAAAVDFLADALARGHEGVVVKSLAAPYDAGRRGAAWVKVKPVHTLDLVVLAGEWGHGRRRGWLSNLHLGARDGAGFVMLGKTFKGLTDEMLRWQTERLLELEVSRDAWQVVVRPELVVEVAFDGVQTSPRYPGGMALRFARVVRHRPDKTAADADDVAAVRALHEGRSGVAVAGEDA